MIPRAHAARERELEIIAAAVAVDIQRLANDIQSAVTVAFKGMGIDLTESDPARGDLRFLEITGFFAYKAPVGDMTAQ